MTESTITCPFCESELSATARKCRYCGEWVQRECRRCGTGLRGEWAARGLCAECEMEATAVEEASAGTAVVGRKSKGTAVLLAFLGGGLGLHKFYLNRPGMGTLYLLTCWTLIPFLVAFFEAFRYLFMSDEEFHHEHRVRAL